MSPVVILYEEGVERGDCKASVYRDVVACIPVRSVEPFLTAWPPGGWVGDVVVVACVSERALKKCVDGACVVKGGGVVFAYRG